VTAPRNLVRLCAVTSALTLTGVGIAFAATTTPTATSTDGATDSAVVASHANHKHGGQDGHLPGSSSGLSLVGQMRINQDTEGRVADVAVHKGHAYVAAFNDGDCQKGGVYVFDIRTLTAPKQVNFIRTANNSYVGEGSQAISLSTPAFTGDVLVHNNETCTGGGNAGGTDQSVGGIGLIDVTNPKTHKVLAQGFGDVSASSTKAHTVHSAFAWQPNADKAYAVLVDNEESADIDIADITDPRSPKIIAEYDLDGGTVTVGGTTKPSGIPLIADGVKGDSESFLHDMVVKKIGGKQVLLASYWDGGYVKLDVTDPTKAKYLADSDFAAVDEQLLEQTGASRVPEGNAHQAEFNADNTYILAADEDFSPTSLVSLNERTKAPFEANSGDGTKQLAPGTKLIGQTVFGGRACPGDAAVPVAKEAGQVAVIERGVCTFTEKVAAVEAANALAGPDYAAALIFNRKGSDACKATLGMSVVGGIPAFGVVGRDVGLGLFGQTVEADCATDETGTDTADLALGTTGDVVSFDSYFDGWGYLRLFANGTGKLKQLDTFAIPEAMDVTKSVGSGDLSVHEVAFSENKPNLAYVSYYSGGTRVFDVSKGKITEVAHHIDADGSNVWGVQVFQSGGKEYVIASDRDYGVQIFEYAPANRP
jgi:hypothetical protein